MHNNILLSESIEKAVIEGGVVLGGVQRASKCVSVSVFKHALVHVCLLKRFPVYSQ